jgi:glycerophosphoryl diester phosphodiesterase
VASPLPEPTEPIVYGCGPGPLAIAHRGGAGLGPENTLAAFGRATTLGFRYLETDARVTRDGVAVAFHDPSLLRVTGVDRPLAATDWAAVRRLRVLGTNCGVERIEDVLACFPDCCFTIDVKTSAAVAPLAEAIRRTGSAARVCVAGGWDSWLAELRARVGPELRSALGWRALATILAAAETRRRPALLTASGFVHLPRAFGGLPVLRRPVIELAHDLGLRVVAWTVDDPQVIDVLLDRGVDGIITDRPDVLRERLIARSLWVPGRTLATASG